MDMIDRERLVADIKRHTKLFEEQLLDMVDAQAVPICLHCRFWDVANVKLGQFQLHPCTVSGSFKATDFQTEHDFGCVHFSGKGRLR